MSQDAMPTRPGQATFAGWLIIGGSVILLLTVWQRMSNLNSLETQEELARVLADPPLSESGLTVSGLTDTVRVLCLIAGGAATAAAILGVHALKRSTSARLALSLLAPLILVSGFATSGFFAPLIVAGVVILWLTPTRDWFAGRAPAQIQQRQSARPDPFAPAARQQSESRTSVSVPPAPEHGPPPHPVPYGRPVSPDAAWSQPAPGTARSPRRPGALVAACIVVWTSCVVLSGLMVMSALTFALAGDEVFDMLKAQQPDFDYQGLSKQDITLGIYVLTALTVVWSIAAMAVAYAAFRGTDWGRIATVVSSAGAGLLSLVMLLANPLMLVVVLACAATIWLLFRPEVTAWFKDSRRVS